MLHSPNKGKKLCVQGSCLIIHKTEVSVITPEKKQFHFYDFYGEPAAGSMAAIILLLVLNEM